MTFVVWAQTYVAVGSVYKLSHYFTQSVQSHKRLKVREASIMSSSTIPNKT